MKNNLALFFPIFLFTVIFMHNDNVYGDKIPPDEVEITTPVYSPKPDTFEPRFGQYTYTVTWQGVPAGTLELNLEQNGMNYQIKASARTNRFVDFFYKLRFNTEALVAKDTLYPKNSAYNSRENHRRQNTEITFLPNGEIESVHEDRRGNVKKIRFNPDNFTLDPFSAVFLALSLEWDVGDTRQFDTFTGKNRYLIELTAIEKTDIRVRGTTYEAIVISPRVKNLGDKNASEDDDRLHEARIYVSTDPSRKILRISSDVFVGSIDTTMVSFAPSDNNAKTDSEKKADPPRRSPLDPSPRFIN